MISSLSIKNYALIDHLEVSFDRGFTCITGETGAGKSILLGGLSLILGKRADLSSLQDKDRKCVIEAEFDIKNYQLKSFFDANDLDYEPTTIIRREILPSGKSRAFINDSPAVLTVLTALGNQLIDVHSQHQTMQLTENDFQLRVIDALAANTERLQNYKKQLIAYRATEKELQTLIDFQQQANKEQDYNSFLLKELEEAPLKLGIQDELEEQYEQLNNVEVIMEALSKSGQLLNNEQVGILALLLELKQTSQRLASFGNQFVSVNERIQSVAIEMDDLASELQIAQDGVEANPQLLEAVNEKLQLLYDLQKKHNVADVAGLLSLKEELSEKVSATENAEARIEEKQQLLAQQHKTLVALGQELGVHRSKVIPLLKKQLEERLASLGMPSATFQISVKTTDDFKSTGTDDLLFLFSANKGSDYGALKKVASGGELSRIMLTIKSILAQYEQLPSLMFDEIDTGVSGEISNRMGSIMQEMSKTMQLFSITHLPQVASKGDQHFKVYKEEDGGLTRTKMKLLTQDERVVELAEMLGGKALSDSAMAHARELLN